MSAPRPDYPWSKIIRKATMDRFRVHRGDGDMWPITWAEDDHLYGAAGDNCDSPMNLWRIHSGPAAWASNTAWPVWMEMLHRMPADPKVYCQRPGVDPNRGIKPAGLLAIGKRMYLAIELHNYGDNPAFNRQRNLFGWIATSDDLGQTWDLHATEPGFFAGRMSSPHFVQFGKAYAGARDGYVYAHFNCGDDGNSYWENGDGLLLGRVPAEKILQREAWEFCALVREGQEPRWSSDETAAVPVFRYPLMTGENHCSYNAGLGRYIMGSYGFLDEQDKPRPYHAAGGWPHAVLRSQLTLFEAPEPWGPWSVFHIDDNWGTYGDYQPNFPTKWMSADGRTMFMVSSGSYDDYNLTIQRVDLELF